MKVRFNKYSFFIWFDKNDLPTVLSKQFYELLQPPHIKKVVKTYKKSPTPLSKRKKVN